MLDAEAAETPEPLGQRVGGDGAAFAALLERVDGLGVVLDRGGDFERHQDEV